MRDSKATLIFLCISSVVNIVLDLATAGILVGSGDVLAAACVTLSVLAVRVASTYIFNYGFHLGFPSLYYANPIGWAFGFIVVWLRFRTGIWKTKAVVKRGKPA